jgi:hypothetical protein
VAVLAGDDTVALVLHVYYFYVYFLAIDFSAALLLALGLGF